MIDIWLWFFTCFNLFLAAKCSIPNEKLCANAACSEPISRAQGSVQYISPSKELLSFSRGKEIIITSKSRNKQDYWGAIIDGKIGYVPSNLIKETQVFQSTDKLIAVPAEVLQNNGKIEGNLNESELPQKSNNLNQINPLPLGSEKPLEAILPESILHTTQEIQKNSVFSNENTNENPSEKSQNADLSFMSDLKEKNKDVSPTKVYSVIEGTTVYMEGNEEEITPSPTIDLKSPLQTSLLKEVNVKVSTENSNEESTLEKQNQIKAGLFPNNFQMNSQFSQESILQNNEKTNLENESGGSNVGNVQNEKKDHVEDVNIHNSEIIDEEVDVDDDDVESDDDDDDGDDDIDADDIDADADDESKNVNNETANLNESDKTVNDILKNEKIISNSLGDNFPDQHLAQEASTQPNLINPGNILTETNSVKPNEIDDIKTKTTPVLNERIDASLKENLEIHRVTDEKNAQVDVKDGIPQILPVSPQVQEINLKIDSPSEHVEGSDGKNVIIESTQDFTKTYTSDVSNDITMPEKSISADTNIPNGPIIETSNPDKQEPEAKTLETNFDKIKETSDDKLPTTVPSVEPIDENIKQQNLNNGNSEVVKDSTPTPTPAPVPAPNSHVNEIVEETADNSETVDESKGMFSWLTSFISNLISGEKERVEENVESIEKIFPDIESIQNEWKEKEGVFDESVKNNPLTGTCENSDMNSGCGEDVKDESGLFWNLSLSSGLPASSNTLLYLIVTAVTVLVFTLGHNFIEKKGKTGPLIAKINKLEQELLVTSKECLLLKDEMRSAKEKVVLYENSANDELVLSLQKELEESKKIRTELESSIEVLQQELDAATEAGLDLNKMLSEVLTQKGGSETLLKSVENLQAQLDSQQKVIDEMTKKLGIKNQENEALQNALQSATKKADSLEEQLNDIKYNLNLHLKEKEDLTQNLNSQISQLQSRLNHLNESKEKEVSKAQKSVEEIQKKFNETTKALTVKQEELKALKDSIKQIKNKGNTNLERLFDVSRIKAELVKEEKENQELVKKLESEVSSKKVLEEQLKLLNDEIKTLKSKYDEAEQKRDEAEKKLEVLSTYFKEKETQLQKELGLQEALWAQKMGDEKTVNNIIKSLQAEVDSYKSQNETLKKEILDQERGLKNQIAVLEQKAHENWVAARQAERKLEENKQETAQLRNRLTLMEKSVSNDVEGKANHRTSEELNGVEANSPILHDTASPLLFPPLPMDPSNSTLLPPGFMPHPMFMPPPIGGFIPPPPLLPGDRRPPPLGRMSSPPLNSRFSPPPLPDYSFERMPSPLSPTRNFRSPNEADRDREHFRHRTPPYPPMMPKNWDDCREVPGFIPISSPRDPRRDQKGSDVSSGHSSSDSLDKSSRNSGRV